MCYTEREDEHLFLECLERISELVTTIQRVRLDVNLEPGEAQWATAKNT
jgi:hypothetical protein